MEEENEIEKIIANTKKSIKMTRRYMLLYKVCTAFFGLSTLGLFAVYYRLGVSPENYIISGGIFYYGYYTATIRISELRLLTMELKMLLYSCEKKR